MLVPQTAEYALRALAYLATLDSGEGIKARDLSVQTSIPLHYLWKIMRRLVLAGLVDSKKGHGGGFSLSRAREEVTIRMVLVALECEPDPTRCAFGWDECNPGNPCPLHPAWSRLNQQFEEWMSSTSLADLGPWNPLNTRTGDGT